MNKRTVGSDTEERAVRFLQENGYSLVMQNYRCKAGEIDIIAFEGGELVFAEVKFRRTEKFGRPEEAVDARKQMRIRKAAQWYLMTQDLSPETPVRFDVIAMDPWEVRIYRNAF